MFSKLGLEETDSCITDLFKDDYTLYYSDSMDYPSYFNKEVSRQKIFSMSCYGFIHTVHRTTSNCNSESETNTNESWIVGDPSTRPSGCLLSLVKAVSSAFIVHTTLTGVGDEKEPAATRRSHFEVLPRESTTDPKVVGGIHPLPTSKHPPRRPLPFPSGFPPPLARPS